MPRKSNTTKVTNPVDNPVPNDSVNDKVVIQVEPIVKPRKPRVSKKDKELVKEEVAVKEVAVKEVEVKEEVAVKEVKAKRGRKSKMELLTALNAATIVSPVMTPIMSPANNIVTPNTVELVVVENPSENEKPDLNVQDDAALDEDDETTDKTDDNVKTTKKRGRKPKGGKIIQNFVANEAQKIEKPNVILHLKCSLKDLQQPSSCLVESYNFNSGNLNYDLLNKNENITRPSLPVSIPGGGINDIKGFNIMANTNSANKDSNKMNDMTKDRMNNDITKDTTNIITKYRESDLDLSRNNYSNYNNNEYDDDYDDEDDDDYSDNKNCAKNVWRKLKQLEHNLHINNVNNKKSACFWCTCDFDNPPIYVPKHYINGTYHVYGCFCSPECGVAYLMNEAIDSSAKFERYHLLNHIYSKVYDYKKNIKPAPNPYYMLEKFYGNLSIQEYRSLLRNERLFLIVDKPLTRILPELHEDNDEFILNNKIIASNNYQLKSRMQKKKPSKGLIMNEKFGLGV